jgi:hypothetical protein
MAATAAKVAAPAQIHRWDRGEGGVRNSRYHRFGLQFGGRGSKLGKVSPHRQRDPQLAHVLRVRVVFLEALAYFRSGVPDDRIGARVVFGGPLEHGHAERAFLQVVAAVFEGFLHNILQECRIPPAVLKQAVGQYSIQLGQHRIAVEAAGWRQLHTLSHRFVRRSHLGIL